MLNLMNMHLCKKTVCLFLLMLSGSVFISCKPRGQDSFCNPLDISYRFQLDSPSRREAADPSIILYKGEYWMFLSKSGGYYHSKNMVDWELISDTNLPIEEYAPTVIAIDDTILFMTKNQKIYKTLNPKSGRWEVANDSLPIRAFDPALFLDDDGRLYLFHGLSARLPIKGVELNRKTLQPIGEEIDLLTSNKKIYGWERSGDYNHESPRRPWVEGAFVTKHNNKYYLHYSVPGTQFKSYADGMYVGNKPLGHYQMAKHNPFSYKPEGFIGGAGHGSTFQDKYGNYWYAGTMSMSVRHRLERRLGIFPAFFDADGIFYAHTGFGDFPHKIPNRKMKSHDDYYPQWMLLSYNKPVEVSSESSNHEKELAINEDIRTFWSASTGEKGEWLLVDLTDCCDVHAIQVNFAENQTDILGRREDIYHQYMVEYSNDKEHWKVLLDKTNNQHDSPHDYTELSKKIVARYIRVTNIKVPSGKFAISGLRVFGKGKGSQPPEANLPIAQRQAGDACVVALEWDKVEGATGYNVRYGTALHKLYHNYQVLGTNSVKIYSLNSLQDYYFTVDAFNENGITRGTRTTLSKTPKYNQP